jgi:hypothetical protein
LGLRTCIATIPQRPSKPPLPNPPSTFRFTAPQVDNRLVSTKVFGSTDYSLGTYIDQASALLRTHGWDYTVHRLRTPADLPDNIGALPHPAARLLKHMRDHGVPCKISTPQWSLARKDAAMARGPHKSALEFSDYLNDEMASMVARGQWMVLPYSDIRHFAALRLSPIGVVPQNERRPRTIVDYSHSHVNQETVRLAPSESMQFGRCLPRLLQKIVHSDPRHGPVRMTKEDVADGFYRLHTRPSDILALGVVFVSAADSTPLVAFPLTCPMGWVESPPWFTTATETGADLANAVLATTYMPGPHRLDSVAQTLPPPPAPTAPLLGAGPFPDLPAPVPSLPQPDSSTLPRAPRRKPLQYVDIYMDDFLGLMQGDKRRQNRVHRVLFESIDSIFRPLASTDPNTRQEPISIKKLLKGDGAWQTTKTMLGWVINSIAETLQLPPRRLLRLVAILDELPRSKTRIATKRWQQIVGELRSMVLAIPGLRGLFSLFQETLRHETQRRIRLTPFMHDFLDDLRWLVRDLHARPTRLREVVDTDPGALGASDAAAPGMGGVIFVPTAAGLVVPLLWRAPFPLAIQRALVSSSNPSGTITNSDLELAGTIAQHDVLVHHADCRERTIHTLTDNTPALAWQTKGSTTTTGPPAYLLRLQALHQRHYRYLPRLAHIKGEANVMADDCSRLWELSDDALLTHFRSRYPQTEPWQLCHLRPEMLSSLISALHKRRPEPASLLSTVIGAIVPGTFGPASAAPSVSTPPSATSLTPSPPSKSSPPASATAAWQPVVNPSGMRRFLPRCATLARRWPTWGPRTLV